MKLLYIFSILCVNINANNITTNITKTTNSVSNIIGNYISNYPYNFNNFNKNYTIQIKKTKITNITTFNIKNIFVTYNTIQLIEHIITEPLTNEPVTEPTIIEEPTADFNILNNLPYITESPTINQNNALSNNLQINKCSSIMCNTNSIIIIIICSSITFFCCMIGLLFYYIKKDKKDKDKNSSELSGKKDIFFIEENTISTIEKVSWNNP